MFLFDLHVHTTLGSADASLRPAQLAPAAAKLGIHGVAVTEHFRHWSDFEVESLQGLHGLVVLRGREFSTSLGHIIAFGLESFSGDGRDPAALRLAAERHGALLIAAHPFRYFFLTGAQNYHPSDMRTTNPEEAATLPIFRYVHALEGLNGHCTTEENAFAVTVGGILGLPVTAGSDAHHADELGRCVIGSTEPIATTAALVEAVLTRRHHIVERRNATSPAGHTPG